MRFVATGCLVLLVVTACSDATSASQALRAEALHFDSLATLATQSHGNQTRIIDLQVIANGLAHGARPGLVTMTIAGTPVTMHIMGIERIDTGALDTGVYIVGWVDSDADTSVSVYAGQDTTGFVVTRVAYVIGDTSASTTTFPAQYPFTLNTSNGSCANYPITNQIATPNMPCHLAQGTVSFTADVLEDMGTPLGTLIVSPSVTFGLVQLVGF